MARQQVAEAVGATGRISTPSRRGALSMELALKIVRVFGRRGAEIFFREEPG